MPQSTRTVNPAGSPRVTETRDSQPYTRETFIRDLGKAAKEPGPKPKPRPQK